MKNALANIRAAVLAGDLSLSAAAAELKKNGFDISIPGRALRLLHLPGRADRQACIDVILRRAELTCKYYFSDTEIDKSIICADTFGGVYAWAARECGTNLVRIGTADGLPDEKGIEFFRACCGQWSGLNWHIIDACGYDVHMYAAKDFNGEHLVNDRIKELRNVAAARAERAAMAAELAAAV